MKEMNLHASSRETRIILVLLLFIASAIGFIGWYIGYHRLSPQNFRSTSLSFSDVVAVYDTIHGNFSGQFEDEKIIMNGISGMMQALDDSYSYYVSAEEHKSYKKKESADMIGIGIFYSYRDGTVRILDVIPESPAEKAGLLRDQTITHIDGIAVTTFTKTIAVTNAFTGDVGEEIRLTVQRGEDTEEVVLSRERVRIPGIVFEMQTSDVAYMKLYKFNTKVADEFPNIANKIKENNVSKIIIDLRNNTGGTDEDIFLVDQFLSEGIIVTERFANGKKLVHRAEGEVAVNPSIRVVVLVNGETASAAETFTAAMQENGRAKVVGEQTFGKGTIGNFFELRDGSAVHLTIGEWLTPRGNQIQGKGITPDIIVEDKIKDGKDMLLEKALKTISITGAVSTNEVR